MATRRAAYVPRRGDIIRLDFDPSAGHEHHGTRPALVLSPEAFNRFGLALACPVTRGGAFARGQAWTVPLANERMGQRAPMHRAPNGAPDGLPIEYRNLYAKHPCQGIP